MPLQTEYFETEYLNLSPVKYSCYLHAWLKRIFSDEEVKANKKSTWVSTFGMMTFYVPDKHGGLI